jgi:probable phosphoglycerate mutase
LWEERRLEQKWPQTLWIVRHGQSAGNVARDAAEAAKAHLIDIEWRDVDTPLSSLGEAQADALGRWFAGMPDDTKPTVVLASPYVRARTTAERIVAGFGDDVTFQVDERLREKEFGALDRLTSNGILKQFPEQVELRRALGKFYYRPPGGESWTDVILRVRSAYETIVREHARKRIAAISHQVVVLCSRYVIERLSEDEILAIDRQGDVANCSETTYRLDPATQQLALHSYNVVAPLQEQGAPVTAHPDGPVAAT